jgi:putative heme degradation protein
VTNVFLGIIAAAVLVMAIIQVAAIVFAARAAQRVGDAVARFEQNVQPIVANLQKVSADAARASDAAAVQVERAGRLLEEVTSRVDETVASLQAGVLGPARDLFAFLDSLKSVFAAFRGDGRARGSRGAHPDDDDALFIG